MEDVCGGCVWRVWVDVCGGCGLMSVEGVG